MKKLSLIIVLALALSVLGTALADKADFIVTREDSVYHTNHLKEHIGDGDVKCTGNYVKLRVSPSESAEVAGHLEMKDEFEITEIRGSWAKVRVTYADAESKDSWRGLTGWMNPDYIQCSCSATEYYGGEGHEQSLEDCIGTMNVVCTTSNLRVRSYPVSGEIVGHIERADRFRLHALEDGWAQIEVVDSAATSPDSWNGLRGWVSADYLAVRGASEPEDNGWKQAYRSYINRLDKETYSRFAVLYVNDDNIPEIACSSEIEAEGCIILTYANGKVNALQTDRLYYTYVEHGNRLCNSDGNMGYYFDTVYQISGGKWKKVAGGEFEAPRYPSLSGASFTWNGRDVDEKEYNSKLRGVFNKSRAREPRYQYSRSGILNYLK